MFHLTAKPGDENLTRKRLISAIWAELSLKSQAGTDSENSNLVLPTLPCICVILLHSNLRMGADIVATQKPIKLCIKCAIIQDEKCKCFVLCCCFFLSFTVIGDKKVDEAGSQWRKWCSKRGNILWQSKTNLLNFLTSITNGPHWLFIPELTWLFCCKLDIFPWSENRYFNLDFKLFRYVFWRLQTTSLASKFFHYIKVVIYCLCWTSSLNIWSLEKCRENSDCE